MSTRLSLSEMVDKGLSIDDPKHYLKVKPKFTHGQKKISFCDAEKAEGMISTSKLIED